MLPATHSLIQYFQTVDYDLMDMAFIRSKVVNICLYGSEVDADALLNVYSQSNRQHYFLGAIIPVLRKLGNRNMAKTLMPFCDKIEYGNEPILELLGFWQYEPAKPILIYHAFEIDPFRAENATMGLLYFDCADIQNRIMDEISDGFNKVIFRNSPPILVCKIIDDNIRQDFLNRLYQQGNHKTFHYCFQGTKLGLSLCGHEGRVYFLQLLFIPNWDCATFAQNTLLCLCKLGITFKELLVMALNEKTYPEYAFKVLLAVLNERFSLKTDTYLENHEAIYQSVFSRQEREAKESIFILAKKYDKVEQLDCVKEKCELMMAMNLPNFIESY